MYCSNCGRQIAEGSNFCNGCGAGVGAAPAYSNNSSTTQTVYVQSQTNIMAVLGLIFAFIFPLLGIIFSCIGLGFARDNNGNGKGIAQAGLWISIIWIVLVVIMVIVAVSQVNNYYWNWD